LLVKYFLEYYRKVNLLAAKPRPSPISLGIRANLAQFALLVGVNGLVGALVGQERSFVPLLGERVFAVGSSTALMLFIVSFGLAKAGANLAAGYLAGRIGRKNVLLLGWIAGIPVPIALMLAPTWTWVIAANVLLGINQGLAWSSTVVMKIDLAGPRQRGLAMGLNEFSGYLAVAISAAVTGWLAARYGLRPEPLFLGLVIAALGLGLSVIFVKETSAHMVLENGKTAGKGFGEVAALASYRHRGLAAASRTGLVNNANDALAWGLLPVVMVGQGLTTLQIGTVAGIYPAMWGIAQLATGALSDRIGRRIPVAAGMWIQALALLLFWKASDFSHMIGASACWASGPPSPIRCSWRWSAISRPHRDGRLRLASIERGGTGVM